jgi:hypothetical protein
MGANVLQMPHGQPQFRAGGERESCDEYDGKRLHMTNYGITTLYDKISLLFVH